MTTYYVDFVHGLDANNGLGPDASHASNKPWKTLAKLLGAAGFASGDTAYLSPSGPFREVVTVNMTSATAETQIIGDPANAQGFKDGSGVLVAPGDVIWTAYTTNDTTTPSANATLILNGRDFLTFKNLLMVGGNVGPSCINANTTNSVNITIKDCVFLSVGGGAIGYTGLADIASNWTVERCYFVNVGNTNSVIINIILPTSASADYDSNFLIQNCVLIDASMAVNINSSGAGAFKGGGVDILNCFVIGIVSNAIRTQTANLSTSIPCTVYNSLIIGHGGAALNANASGQIVEDYNLIMSGTPRTNVSVGANSVSDLSHAPLIEVGYELISGRQLRPFGMPMASSPLLGRGNQAGGPTVDILNRPRPAGGGSASYAWGAYERHDTWVRETTTVRTGANALSCTGPGDQDFYIPVDAVSTTVTVYARYDTNHAATNKPQMQVLNGEEIGVASATATMTAAVDTWEQLSLNFTPTAKGVVTIRFISRAAAGNGKAFFDDFDVT